MKMLIKALLTILGIVLLLLSLIPLFLLMEGKQGFIFGLFAGIAYMGLFCYGIFGLIVGKIRFFPFKGRLGALCLGFISILFLVYTSGLTLINIFIEEEYKNPGFTEKARIVANKFVPLGYMEDLKEEKFNEITIRYPAGTEDTVQQIKQLYPDVLEENQNYFGEVPLEPLTIFVYPSRESMIKYASLDDIGGYYQHSNQSIHLLSMEQYDATYRFIDVMRHEITHYMTNMFVNLHEIDDYKIPLWFHEGIAEVVGYDAWKDIDFEAIDFQEMDTHNDFQRARKNNEPYIQSYYAVRELVLAHGDGIISELLLATQKAGFYDGFQTVTGMTIEEFENTFMNRKERVLELSDIAYDAAHQKNYEKAEALFLEIMELDQGYGYGILPYIYIKQLKVDEAIKILEENLPPHGSGGNYKLLSELYLMKDIDVSLKYANQYADSISKVGDFSERWLEALNKLKSEQKIEGYIELLQGELIFYHEIKREIYKQLRRDYPDDPRV
jgi:hypothetical protein